MSVKTQIKCAIWNSSTDSPALPEFIRGSFGSTGSARSGVSNRCSDPPQHAPVVRMSCHGPTLYDRSPSFRSRSWDCIEIEVRGCGRTRWGRDNFLCNVQAEKQTYRGRFIEGHSIQNYFEGVCFQLTSSCPPARVLGRVRTAVADT